MHKTGLIYDQTPRRNNEAVKASVVAGDTYIFILAVVVGDYDDGNPYLLHLFFTKTKGIVLLLLEFINRKKKCKRILFNFEKPLQFVLENR